MTSRRTRENANKKKEEFCSQMMPYVEQLDEATRILFNPLLDNYAWLSGKIEELKKDINKEGFLVDDKENPKINILHKMTLRQSDLFVKLGKALKNCAESKEEKDPLDEWLKG